MYNIKLQAKKNIQPKIKDDSALNNSTLIQMSTKSSKMRTMTITKKTWSITEPF